MLGGTDKQSLFGGELKPRAAVPPAPPLPSDVVPSFDAMLRDALRRFGATWAPADRFAAPTCCPVPRLGGTRIQARGAPRP